MSDFSEMTEAFEQARTAPDVTDRASGLEEADRIGGVAMVLAKMQGQGQDWCEECGEELSADRRKHAPWAIRCVPCQEVVDQMEARRRG